MRRLWALVLPALWACGDPAPPTEAELRAREQRLMEKELTTSKARGYFALRDELAQPLLKVKEAAAARSEISSLLSIAYLMAGRTNLALYEFADIEPGEIPEAQRPMLGLLGGMIYAAHEWPHLSDFEFSKAAPPAGDRSPKAEETRRLIEYARVLGPLSGGNVGAARKQINRRKTFFDVDPLGGVLRAAVDARGGDFGPAADELLKAVDASSFDEPTKDELRRAAEELRTTKDVKSFARGLMLRWSLISRGGIDEEARRRLAPLLDQVRKVAGDVFGKSKF